MEILLIIGLVVAVALLLVRPVPQPKIIYVPVAVEERRRGLGCLWWMVAGVLILVVMVAMSG